MAKTQSKQINVFIVDNDPERKKIYSQVFDGNINITYRLISKLSEILRSKKIDSIVVYLESVTQDKIDFLYKMKSENPRIYIILITEPVNSKEVFRLAENSFDNYLFTPFSANDLTTVIRNVI